MRRLSIAAALLAVLSLSGCKASLFGDSEEVGAKKAALEAEAKKIVAERAAKDAMRAEEAMRAEAEQLAAAEAVADGAERGEPAPAEDQAAEDPRLEDFAQRLENAGFGPLGRETLLPDLLGGLDLCDAALRTKISFEKGYATMGRYPDAAAAKKCLEAYFKMPGAARFKHLYTLRGVYMLELHPRMAAKDMSAIRTQFEASLAR